MIKDFFVRDLIWCDLLYNKNGEESSCYLPNAGLTAQEVVHRMKYKSPKRWNVWDEVSVGYVSVILRHLREAILTSFFTDYPAAVWIRDWRELSRAVAVYTTDEDNCWMPNRRAVVDARQKMELFEAKRCKDARYNADTHYLTWRDSESNPRRRVISSVAAKVQGVVPLGCELVLEKAA